MATEWRQFAGSVVAIARRRKREVERLRRRSWVESARVADMLVVILEEDIMLLSMGNVLSTD